MPEGSQYKIISNTTLSGIEADTRALIENGWQIAGPVTFVPEKDTSGYSERSGYFFREMILIAKPPMQIIEEQRREMAIKLAQEFQSKYENLDSKVKDLLDINNISVFNEDGQLFTRIGDKVSTGISPTEVLAALKASKHCPLDLDEQWFLDEIGGLL